MINALSLKILTLSKTLNMKLLFGLVFFLMTTILIAQDETLTFGFTKPDIETDTVQSLDFNTTKKGKVTIHQDPRVNNITEFIGRNRESINGSKIDGYRIQIFFAESRTTAQSQKASFINSHGEHKAYLEYLAPNYRVRVGNFRTRLEAEALKQELISVYPTCIIISDKIELPVINLEENNPEIK